MLRVAVYTTVYRLLTFYSHKCNICTDIIGYRHTYMYILSRYTTSVIRSNVCFSARLFSYMHDL